MARSSRSARADKGLTYDPRLPSGGRWGTGNYFWVIHLAMCRVCWLGFDCIVTFLITLQKGGGSQFSWFCIFNVGHTYLNYEPNWFFELKCAQKAGNFRYLFFKCTFLFACLSELTYKINNMSCYELSAVWCQALSSYFYPSWMVTTIIFAETASATTFCAYGTTSNWLISLNIIIENRIGNTIFLLIYRYGSKTIHSSSRL